MPYAIDLAGLTTIKVRNDFVLKTLLADVLDMDHPVECALSKMAGTGIPFTCEEQRAKAIVTVIRMQYKHCDLPIYYSKTGNGGWRYINERDLVTMAENGDPRPR